MVFVMARTYTKPTGRPKGPLNPAVHRADDITEIHLTGGAICLIDTDDYELVQDYRWYAHCNGDCCYARTSFALPSVDGKRQRGRIMMHRLLVPGEDFLDHKNHNGLDNRRQNIRKATQGQNAFNRIKIKRSNQHPHLAPTSLHRGVSFCQSRQNWTAMIQVEGKYVHLGSYVSEEEAWEARQQGERKYYPDFEWGKV